MVVNEAFQVAAMIEKFLPSWRYFKNYLKHKHKEMKLEDLVIRLKIEKDNKTAEKKSRGNSTIMEVNIVEETAPKSKKRKRSSGQTKEQNKKKFKGNCYNFGNLNEWWIDSGSTRYVCAVKEAFVTYSTVGPEEVLSMENTATAKIEGYGKIFLKMTSGKSTPSSDGKKYSITFIDDCTRYCYVYFLNSKDEAIESFKQYKNEVENQLNKKIKMIRIIESDNVEFFENIYPYKTECESSSERTKRPREEPKENTPSIEDQMRSKRQRTSTSFGPDFVTILLENEPQTFKADMSSSDSVFWEEAVNRNKPLGSKWIFKRKMKADETIDKYKTRLVIKVHEVIVCLYVDDILIMSKDMAHINATKCMLASKFEMKELGVADVILRIRIHKIPQGLTLSQSHYIEKPFQIHMGGLLGLKVGEWEMEGRNVKGK
ncbi:uncharacterized protein [Nicotiana tomentosiformis]|uniref:uncharacterized protein n=1 Tax=Nicotiana tomentosiformis TaxID=4098 RepID=UPI00388CBF1C